MNQNKKEISLREKAIFVVALIFAVFHLYTAVTGSMIAIYQRSIHFMFAAVLVFLLHPTRLVKDKKIVVNSVIDILLISCAVIPIAYLFFNEKWLITRFFYIEKLTWYQYMFCIMLIISVLEGTRRKLGYALPIIALIAMAYMLLGKYLPGVFGNGGFSTIAFVDTLYTTTEGIFGTALGASATFVVLFVIFGSFLEASGVGDYFIKVAMALTQKSCGGSAKATVISSSLFGSISGSAIANVATTGQITIPLMKRNGYSAVFAGAVEAVASTGGQIMPPVMGAIAFIMAEYTGIPYAKILVAALVPALLYYTAVFVMVHLEAKKLGLRPAGETNQDLKLTKLIKSSYLFLPLIVLVVFLMKGYSATFACIYSLIAVIAVSFIKKETRIDIKTFMKCLVSGAKGCVGVAMACACSGIIVGIVNYTGIGTRLSSALINISGNSLLMGLIFTAISCLILGMGLPSTPSYIVVATLLVPTLIKMGVTTMGAHLFAFYFASIANITPPVALAAYTAAGLSGASPMKTGYCAFRLGIAAYIVPFMFALNSALLMDLSLGVMVVGQAVITSFIGVFCLASAVEGYLVKELKIWQRIFMMVAAVLMVKTGTITDFIGFILAGIVLLAVRLHGKSDKR